jgi:hypothetical protein
MARAMTAAMVDAGVTAKRKPVSGVSNDDQRSVQERITYGAAPMGVSSE